ncbi:MAG: LPS export ABC transporter ATP-binding protein [Fimbriimonadaceae bacterium]|nr:LPS export ABC transporter ATP-binding protein [Fimbriimonadaceae bacterium]
MSDAAPDQPQRVLQTAGLIKAYRGRKVVNHVSINVRAGEIVGLLGQNGAGKTTTFYMVVGLVRPDQGQVLLDGRDITRQPMHVRAREGLGYLAQDASIFRRLTVEENLTAILELQPISAAERRDRTERLLRELHITERRDQVASTLSGGERRRAEIARALATEPTFLLLDEPFTGVDPLHVSEIREIVHSLRERLGLGVLLTDHNPQATLRLCDRAYIIAEGEILLEGSSRDIAEHPVAREKYLGEDFRL